MNPIVKENLDALGVVLAALKAAEAAQKSVAQIAELFPEDKRHLRAKKDVEGMIARFEKRAEAVRKSVRAVASKEMPPALKKLGEASARIVAARMVDPSKLRVIPWVGETWEKKPIYSVFLRIESGDRVFAYTGTNVLDVSVEGGADAGSEIRLRLGRVGCVGMRKGEVVTPEFVAVETLKCLVGWPGIKGEAEATEGRRGRAEEIARIMQKLVSGGIGFDRDKVEKSADLRKISTAYRSHDLPKEGERAVGEGRYSEMTSKEFTSARKAFEGALIAHKDQIEGIEIHDGEKSWIYITVTLK